MELEAQGRSEVILGKPLACHLIHLPVESHDNSGHLIEKSLYLLSCLFEFIGSGNVVGMEQSLAVAVNNDEAIGFEQCPCVFISAQEHVRTHQQLE